MAPLAPAGLVGDIIKRFEQRGYKLVGCKASCWPSAAQAAVPLTWHSRCCWCVTSAWHACAWHALPASHRNTLPLCLLQVLVPSRELAAKHYVSTFRGNGAAALQLSCSRVAARCL